MNNDKQISARIPEPMASALARIASENDRSFAAELRRAIRVYLSMYEAPGADVR